jgi:hypothetical protein
MAEVHEELSDFMQEHVDGAATDPFHMFEPWDVVERPQWLIDQSIEDDADLHAKEHVKMYGTDPHPFQTGFMTDKGTIAVAFAGNRVGKSYCALINMLIQTTGELPYCFRYDVGEDTGVPRVIDDDNIQRWGRYCKQTGKFLDKDTKAVRDGTWDCGNVTGVGKYPTDMIVSPSAKLKTIWVCTKKQAWEEMWWKQFKAVVPKYMLDTKRGIDGFNEKKRHVYLNGGYEIHGLTYDQGAMSFEAVEVPYLYMDEEAPQAVYAAALYHCTRMRIIETPYKGVTWTYDMLLLRSMEEDSGITVYHASQFDSPYLTKEWIRERRNNVKRWEMKARLYGFHSDQAGRPFYEEYMQTLRAWSTNLANTAEYVNFLPTVHCDDYRSLCQTRMQITPAQPEERGEWHMYEKAEPDTAYWLTADTAEGNEDDEQAAADRNSAIVWRAPRKNENPLFPVMVAACRSTRETIYFARSCVYACIYYNCALLAPEIKGETGGSFKTEVREYPYLYTMTVVNDKTNRPQKKIGYITTGKTRQQIFDLAGDFLAEFKEDVEPKIPYLPLIKELMACVVGKKGRPDHTRKGTTDTLIAFGVGIYVYQVDRNQIRNNRFTQQQLDSKKKDWYDQRGLDGNKKKKAVFSGRR